MAKINISHTHGMSPDEVKKRVDDLFEHFKDKFQISKTWNGNVLNLHGSGFEGEAKVSGDKVDVEVKLGMLASAFKGQIESGIKAELEKRLKA